MNPGLTILLSLFLPLVLVLLLVAPVYLGMLVGLYLQYGDAVLGYVLRPDYVLSVYMGLYDYWEKNADALKFMDFTLPTFGPLAAGILLGLGLFIYLIRYLKNIFIMSMSEH